MEDFSQEFQQENDLIFTQFFDDSKKLFFRIIHGITCLSVVREKQYSYSTEIFRRLQHTNVANQDNKGEERQERRSTTRAPLPPGMTGHL